MKGGFGVYSLYCVYRGTYANVFLGTDRRSNQQVAVKRINKRLTFNNSSLARMIIDEIRILHHVCG